MAQTTENFWNVSHATYEVVSRRILFQLGQKIGEVVISIAPGQPVLEISTMSEAMLKEATVTTAGLKAGDAISPQLVFAPINQPETGSTPVAFDATHRALPVWQIVDAGHTTIDTMSFQEAMKATHAATPTAIVSPGDYAVGFLAQNDVLNFYPLMAVNIPEEIESYKSGESTTDDVIPLLPFQS